MQKVMDNPAVRDRFYEELSSAVTAPSRFKCLYVKTLTQSWSWDGQHLKMRRLD